MLDPALGRLEFSVPGFSQGLRAFQLPVERHVRGHVPFRADHFRRVRTVLEADRPRADIADLAVGKQQAVFRRVSSRGNPLFEFLSCSIHIARMDRCCPVVDAPRLVRRFPVDFTDAVVPQNIIRLEIELPNADLRRVECQLQTVRKPPQPLFATAQIAIVLLPLLDKPAGHHDRNNDQGPPDQHDRSQ